MDRLHTLPDPPQSQSGAVARRAKAASVVPDAEPNGVDDESERKVDVLRLGMSNRIGQCFLPDS